MIEGWKELRIPSPFGNGQPKLEEYFDKLKKRGVLQLNINTIKEVCKVYQLVAKNPNAPTDTLLMLGFLLPADFIQNPILPLLILENPNFIDKNYNTQIAIACHPETPVNILKYLMESGRPGVLKYIAQNPNTPVEFLEKMAEEAIRKPITLDETPEGIAKNPKTPAHILEKLAVYMNNIKIDPIWFTENSEECQFNLAIALAEHPNTSAYIWEQLVSSQNPSIRQYLVKYYNLPVTLLERLAKDSNKYVRLAIAEKTTNPHHIIRQLAQDKDRQVKEAVVNNSSTPILLLDELAKGNDSQIRALASVEYNKRIREQYKSRNFKQWW